MDDRELEELEDPETWDPDSYEVLPPVANPKAVVPVAFNVEEIGIVARFARERDVKITHLIHDAVLAHIEQSRLVKGT